MRIALIAGLAMAALIALLLIPPIQQDPGYHNFADQRAFWGVPNFYNVATNVVFLLVALWGVPALWKKDAFQQLWERVSYAALLGGLALVSCGSAYYHAWPSEVGQDAILPPIANRPHHSRDVSFPAQTHFPMIYHRRHLPHYYPIGQPLFLTWSLDGSIPEGRHFLPRSTEG